jgi:hypothetical protein
MRERMAMPGAKERYNRRIATVEPVFSYIEDAMGFRRASSRKTETVKSEILLKVLAYNLLRLRAVKAVAVCFFAGVYNASEMRILASWVPIWSIQISNLAAISKNQPLPKDALQRNSTPLPAAFSGSRLMLSSVRNLFPSIL